jgi:hypothetical protein
MNKFNLKIIGISGNDLDYNFDVGKNIIGNYFYKNNYDVHLLKISDELKLRFLPLHHKLITNTINNNITCEYINSIWNDGFVKIIKKIYNGTYPITSIFRYFYMICNNSLLSLLSYIPFKFNFIKYNSVKIPSKHLNEAIEKSIKYNIEIANNLFNKQMFSSVINNMFTEYKIKKERKNNLIWLESLHLKMLNILEKSYDKNKIIFIICDIQCIKDLKFFKQLGGKLIRFDNKNIEYNNNNPIYYDILTDFSLYDYTTYEKLKEENVNRIMKILFPNDHFVSDIFNKKINNENIFAKEIIKNNNTYWNCNNSIFNTNINKNKIQQEQEQEKENKNEKENEKEKEKENEKEQEQEQEQEQEKENNKNDSGSDEDREYLKIEQSDQIINKDDLTNKLLNGVTSYMNWNKN